MLVFRSIHVTSKLVCRLPKLLLKAKIRSIIPLVFSHSKTPHSPDQRYPGKEGSLPLNLKSQFVISNQKAHSLFANRLFIPFPKPPLDLILHF
jgi:hypothetical protein